MPFFIVLNGCLLFVLSYQTQVLSKIFSENIPHYVLELYGCQ